MAVLVLAASTVFVAGLSTATSLEPLPEPRTPELSAPLVMPIRPETPATPPEPNLSGGGLSQAGASSGALSAPALPLAAGRMPGTFGVTNSGAATYTIPLWTPPGVGSVNLNLALNYSSRGASGVAGHGWSLAGLSSISRCNRTWAQDGGAPAPVTNNSLDRFCLDGQQLKLVSGNYGQAGSVYATEIESFSRIVANGSIGAGPASFTVTTKNGLIYEYGTTVDSQVYAGATGPIRTWALSAVRDRSSPTGNRITLQYANEAQAGAYTNGSHRIAAIRYPTTATGQGPFYEVSFSYSPRPASDVLVGYLAGNRVREANQLDAITITSVGSGTPIKSYHLAYSTGPVTGRLRLDAVQECSASACLPPTNVSYLAGDGGWSAVQSTTQKASTGATVIPIDLNADGFTDLLFPKASGSSNSRWWAMLSSASGFGTATDTQLVTANASKVLVAPFSGRGQAQLLMVQGGYWHVVSYTGNGFSSVNTNVPAGGEFAALDYDGDGLPDLASVSGTTVSVRRNLTPPAGAVTFAATPQVIWTASGMESIGMGAGTLTTFADFNGDGRGDLLVKAWSGPERASYVLYSNGFGPTASVTQLALPLASPLPGDWNGDGCTDIVSLVRVLVSDCRADFATISVNTAGSTTAAMAADQDGDGRVDLLYADVTTTAWYVRRSSGEGIGAPVPLGLPAPSSTAWFVFDQNGDGLVDLGFREGSSSGTLKYHLHGATAAPADVAASFVDGFGIGQYPTYASIARGSHTKHADASFPYVDWSGPLYVVNQFTADDGTGSTYQNQFWYYGAQVHTQGRGFAGFYAQRILDTRNDLATFDYVNRTFPHTGEHYQQIVQPSGGGYMVSSWYATYNHVGSGGAGVELRYFPYVESTNERRHEVSAGRAGALITEVVTNFAYDGYGNPTAVSRTVSDRDQASPFFGSQWQSLTQTSYANDASATWCLGLPSSVAVTDTAPGQLPKTRSDAYAIDPVHCRITGHVAEPNDPALTVTTTLGFDGCGNVASLAVVGSAPSGPMPARTTSIDHGSRCQAPVSVTNAEGETTSFVHHPDFVVPTRMTDANGVPTDWTYDSFGRRILEIRPDGTRTSWSFAACPGGPCWGVPDLLFIADQVDTDAGGASYGRRTLYYDGLERLRYDVSRRANDLDTWQVFQYDSLGRRIVAYLPYTGAGSGHVTWSHDVLNRVTEQRLYQASGALDRTSTISYSGRSTTITDPFLRSTTQIHDPMGRLRRVIDPAPGGTSYYDYDSRGHLTRIEAPGGAISTGEYGVRGFRTRWTDADRGEWTFTGNSLNETIGWRNAKLENATAEYDRLGRLTKRVEPEGTSTWTWGDSAAAHNLGRLEAVAGQGYWESLTYDGLGRLATRRVSTDQTYFFDYSYNAAGLLDTLTYPASPVPSGQSGTRFKVQYGYRWGQPVSITDVTDAPAVQPLWTLVGDNPYGTPTEETLGGGIASVRSEHTPWTNELISRRTGSAPGASDRQDLAYQWNEVGNLTQRQELLQLRTEGFEHDALDRLTRATLNGSETLAVSYLPSGNIASKSDVGSYGYADPAHPHAVTSAGAKSFAYDANGTLRKIGNVTQYFTSYGLPTDVRINGLQGRFKYGPDRQRWRQIASYSNGTETTHYVGEGLLEKVHATSTGHTYFRHYVETPGGQRIVVSRNSNHTGSRVYQLTDHLGSTEAVLDAAGSVYTRQSFAAFGGRRGSDWTAGTLPDLAGIANTSRHGFTGHEHLDNLALIHMNGRVYDPQLGRFLSVDPLIGNLTDSQSVNPYAYVGNRPLSYTDPTGLSAADGNGGGSVGGGPGYQKNDGSPGSWKWWGEVFDDIGEFFSLGSGRTPPPASALPGISAQNGVAMCGPGSFSPTCGGMVLYAGAPGVGAEDAPTSSWANRPGKVGGTSGARWEPPMEEPLRGGFSDLLRQLVEWSSPPGMRCGDNVNCLAFPMWGTPRGGGGWMMAAETMSARAAAYQAQIAGRAGQVYVLNGVKFDGFANGVLLEAKGPGYARFARSGVFRAWWSGADDLVAQAQRQLAVARGVPIQWHFAEAAAADAARALFQQRGIKGIEILVTP